MIFFTCHYQSMIPQRRDKEMKQYLNSNLKPMTTAKIQSQKNLKQNGLCQNISRSPNKDILFSFMNNLS